MSRKGGKCRPQEDRSIPSCTGGQFECVHQQPDARIITQYPRRLDERISHLEDEKNSLNLTNQSLHAVLRAHEQKLGCEALYAQGHIKDAAVSLRKIANTPNEAVRTNDLIARWITGEFRCRKSEESVDFYHQSLRTDACRHWKPREAKHRQPTITTKRLWLTLLRCPLAVRLPLRC